MRGAAFRVLATAPLPDSGRGLPAEDVRLALRRRHEVLLADRETVTLKPLVGIEPNKPPVVRLAFAGPSIVIDADWCRYFRAQLHSLHGPAWLARAAFFDPDAREVYLKPRQDPVDLEAAILWGLDRDNPIVRAEIGFNYVHPMRTVKFPMLDISRLH